MNALVTLNGLIFIITLGLFIMFMLLLMCVMLMRLSSLFMRSIIFVVFIMLNGSVLWRISEINGVVSHTSKGSSIKSLSLSSLFFSSSSLL